VKTKHLLPLLFSLLIIHAGAGEFRFVHMETTGLCNSVHVGNEKETAIVITKDSDADAVALLDALLNKQIYGTQGVQDHRGAKWEQAIILIGEFASKTKRTTSGPNTAPSEEYRDFRITGLKVLFPVSRFEVAGDRDPIVGPVIIETHFGFDSLFPHGVTSNGKPIDLSNHAIKRGESK
jgi:hypothetical protein